MPQKLEPAAYLDVTDLVEFLGRLESVSGVQRVIARVAPLLPPTFAPVVLDRGRGEFVELTQSERSNLLISPSSDPGVVAAQALGALDRIRDAGAIHFAPDDVLLFLGAVWINDAVLLAARRVHAAGVKLVFLLYDLTPVLEAGHTHTVQALFERYLALLATTATRVPAISASSRKDFERYCQDAHTETPPGRVTGLPCGITPIDFQTTESPWPRPYALFVGTIEGRKNHHFALRAWRLLIERFGRDAVPDLVCVGRFGWRSKMFLDEFVATSGLDGKVHVISSGVSDDKLARLYAHSAFTIYPSTYEGWGLPVSESIAFGKVVIAADNSSMREAGRDLAIYTPTGDLDAFVEAVGEYGINETNRQSWEQRLAAAPDDMTTWQHVADVLRDEVAAARSAEFGEIVLPTLELGHEYALAQPVPAPSTDYADQYMNYLQNAARTPLLRQPFVAEAPIVDAALIGDFGSPQTWGYELRPGRSADLRFARPADGDLVVLFSTRSMPGVVRIEAVGPGGLVSEDVYLGSVLRLPLGEGLAGEGAQVTLTVTDASDSIEGFLGLRSFVILRADDAQAEIVAWKSAAEALRQELDFVTNTRSWKITAPLRKLKGRGA
jgi:glycosyltransferase involved in cell wall biosynthesis